jgi:hypothetical protein
VLKRALPNWNDEKGVVRLAGEIVADWETELETRSRPFLEYADSVLDDFPKFMHFEKEAVEAARRGNNAMLAELLESEHLEWLGTDARKIIADILLGTHKVGRGRPKMTSKQRWAKNPIHRAALEVAVLRQTLCRLYPEQTAPAVRDCALRLAAKRTGVALGTLRQHLRRPKNDRRRINKISP